MTEQEKLNLLITAFKNLFDRDISDIKLTDDLNDLELDSLDIVELQMEFEDMLGKELPNLDSGRPIVTVGDLLSIL